MYQSQLNRHLKRRHKNEEAVMAALKLPKADQKKAFDRIRKEGIFEKNLCLAKEGSPLIRERRQGPDSDLKMCGGCNGFFKSKQLYRHKKKCEHVTGTSGLSINFSKLMVTAESLGISNKFKAVLDSFRDDPAGQLCQTDPFIILLGKRLWAKNMKRDKYSVMSDMRLFANIILRMRVASLNDDICGEDILDRIHFETLSSAISFLSSKENGGMKAGLKLKIGYLLKKLIKIAKGHYIQLGKMDKSNEVDYFGAVLDLNWDYIFYSAQINCEQRRNSLRKPQAMPIEEDIQKLRNFILDEMRKMTEDTFRKWNSQDFVKMRNLIVSRLTMFNARRGGEPARLTLEEWKEAANDAWVDSQLILTIKDPLEKALLNQYKLAYQAGKGSKKLVPILIPNDTLKHIEKLVESRADVDILESNPFLFANTGSSMDHVIGWQAIKFVIKMMGADLEKPELLIADKFRHRMSTLFAIMDLPPSQREIFYRHMGHSEDINKHVYQCPLSVGEIVTVGGFLKNIDEPSTSKAHDTENASAQINNSDAMPDDSNHPPCQPKDNKDTNDHACQDELSDMQNPQSQSSTEVEKCNMMKKSNPRRLYRWSEKQTELIKNYFSSFILGEGHGSKGSLPKKKKRFWNLLKSLKFLFVKPFQLMLKYQYQNKGVQ